MMRPDSVRFEAARDAPVIVWFRRDLRLADNPAVARAARLGRAVVPLFIWAPDEEDWPPGAATRWWLHRSLASLARDLGRRNARLIIRRGPAGQAVREMAVELRAATVIWNRCYEPALAARDAQIEAGLKVDGIAVENFNSSLLFEPRDIQTSAGAPFQVFTPFWRKCLAQGEPVRPLPAPNQLTAPSRWPRSLALEELQLRPSIGWDSGLEMAWTPGEAGAAGELKRFLKTGLAGYALERDRPDHAGTSRLSPHLHFGEIGPGQIWRAVRKLAGELPARQADKLAEPYLRQLVWREFAQHLLYHFPHTPKEPLRPAFARFPWEVDEAGLCAWQRGKTGFPYIDAGMRELWTTGWMHNRVRMAVGSFLVKDLLLPWQEGARWFWDTLVDADLANNTLGWQWVAGCGADAAPYFRIFNPVGQGEKCDPQGAYVRRWVPELARLGTRWIHRPWEAPLDELQAAGIELGRTYPRPIVDHATARRRALEALATLKQPARTD